MLKIKPLYLIAIVLIAAFAAWQLTLVNRYPSTHITLLTVKSLDSSLNASNKLIQLNSNLILNEFDKDLAKPELMQKAAIWSPVMHAAAEYTDRITLQMETLKTQLKKAASLQILEGEEKYHEDDIDAVIKLMISQGEGKKLMDSLKAFSEQIKNLVPEQLRGRLPPLPIANSSQEPLANYFEEAPAIAAVGVLTKLQNDVLRSGNMVVNFCNNNAIGCRLAIIYDEFDVLVWQNSTALLPNQILEIKAGLGTFSVVPKPFIIIAGEEQLVNGEGVAVYKHTIKAGEIRGDIPISISFKNPDTGETVTKTSVVSYTVTKR